MREISFHNTIAIAGPELETAEGKAVTQEEKILDFFRTRAGREYTPCEVHTYLQQQGKINALTPITSTRRAISNLTTQGKLVKTDIKRKGAFNVVNFTWTYNGIPKQGELFD
jgi:hypothetical protein